MLSSGRNVVATAASRPTWTTGKRDGALLFDRATTCLTVGGAGDPTATGPFTVSALVDVTAYSNGSKAGFIASKSLGVPDKNGWRFSSDTVSSFSMKLGEAAGPFEILTGQR